MGADTPFHLTPFGTITNSTTLDGMQTIAHAVATDYATRYAFTPALRTALDESARINYIDALWSLMDSAIYVTHLRAGFSVCEASFFNAHDIIQAALTANDYPAAALAEVDESL